MADRRFRSTSGSALAPPSDFLDLRQIRVEIVVIFKGWRRIAFRPFNRERLCFKSVDPSGDGGNEGGWGTDTIRRAWATLRQSSAVCGALSSRHFKDWGSSASRLQAIAGDGAAPALCRHLSQDHSFSARLSWLAWRCFNRFEGFMSIECDFPFCRRKHAREVVRSFCFGNAYLLLNSATSLYPCLDARKCLILASASRCLIVRNEWF